MGCIKLDILNRENTGLKVVYRKVKAEPKVVQWFYGIDPLAELAPDWNPYRYGFNNPILYTDPDGMFESRADAEEYAKQNNIKTGWFRSNKIVENSDGTYSIDNKRKGTSTSDLGGDLGVMTGALLAADDIMKTDVIHTGFLNSSIGTRKHLRDGSIVDTEVFGPMNVVGGMGTAGGIGRMGAAKTSSQILSWGNNAKGHLIKHADVLGYGGHTPQQLQKMLPQLRSAANQLYNNLNPALTKIGSWPGQTDKVLMHITNDGKMLVTKLNGEFITAIPKTSNINYVKAIPYK